MVFYSIKVKYRTGDSFSTYETTDEVGLNWERLDKAQLAMQYFMEHLEAYKNAHNDDHRRSPKASFDVESIKKKPWYYELHSEHDWESTLVVEKDDGEAFGMNVFWLGFFEKFHSAEICISSNDEDYFWDYRKTFDDDYYGEKRSSLSE